MAWIECRVDASPVAYGVECPKDVAAWASRFQAMNASLRKFAANAPLDFGIASYLAAFQITRYGGTDLAAHEPPLGERVVGCPRRNFST